MHFFGLLGSLMFLLGFIAVIIVGSLKLYYMYSGHNYRLVTDSPYFYLSLTSMIIGSQLFLAGFLGELIIRHSNDRNHYEIGEEITEDTRSDIPALEAKPRIDELQLQQTITRSVPKEQL